MEGLPARGGFVRVTRPTGRVGARLARKTGGERRYTTKSSAESVMHTLPPSANRWKTKCR